MKPEFAALPEGFSIDSYGRSGSVYFRAQERVMELYFEMSGVDDYDCLLSLEDTKEWAHPKKEKVAEAERQQIVDALESWLRSKQIRTDAFAPIKRDFFPQKK